MRVAIHQPAFLPWIGFWNRLVLADTFILLPEVQFTRDGFLNRVRLNDNWLTIPVHVPGPDSLISEVLIEDKVALDKVTRTLEQSVASKKNPYRHRVHGILEAMHAFQVPGRLVDLNLCLIEEVLKELYCQRPQMFCESKWDGGDKTGNLLQSIAKRCGDGPHTYLTGEGALDYLDMKMAAERGIEVKVQRVKADMDNESIVKLLVTHDDPLGVIRTAAWWR